MKHEAGSRQPLSAHYDVVVIGAGFGGMYAVHRLRQTCLSLQCFEAGDGVGGTWYWNRYPGARVDIESMEYSYSFDHDLQQEWKWPELFSPQADLEAYANHVADRFNLRENIRFGTRVNGLRFDEANNLWRISTDQGDHVTAKYVIAATGALNATNVPPFAGLDSFEGDWYHTSRWPHREIGFANKRVGLIGTGSTGIQVATEIAPKVGHLLVFQRTPAYSLPAMNLPLDEAVEREWKDNYPERRAKALQNHVGAFLDNIVSHGSVFDHSPQERDAIYEQSWKARKGLLFSATFSDIMTSIEANETAAEFVRNKIRQIVKDPQTAELLLPRTYPLGAKRMCMDTGYFEIFNRDNVTLVDVRTHPIIEFTPKGLRTSGGDYALDIVILATGFDAVTGSLTRMNITGRGGMDLRDKWAQRATNFLGIFVAGFPNLFMIHGPGSPGVLSQMIVSAEWQVNWIAALIEDMERRGRSTVDTTPEQEMWWAAEMDEAADKTLYKYADSWYVGANIPGKPRGFMVYIGGFDRYTQRCTDQAASGYRGCVFDN